MQVQWFVADVASIGEFVERNDSEKPAFACGKPVVATARETDCFCA